MKLAVLFDNFGPYHLARLNSLAERCTLVGIEFHSTSSEYSWTTSGQSSFEHRTLLSSTNTSPRDLSCAVGQALSNVAPDAVFIPGWDHIGSLSALMWCRWTRTPAVIMSDSQERDAARVPLKEWVKRRALNHASACLVAGQRHRSYVEKLGVPAEFIKTGYDVVDNDYFRREAEALRRSMSPRRTGAGYFLASARFIARKNLYKLVDGYGRYRAQLLQRQATPKKLVILGDGPECANLNAWIRVCGLSDAVHLAGFVQYPDLPKFYAHATAFIHIPVSEQWGLVVNEALASGLPAVVSSACGCSPDLVFEGLNGFVIDAEDTERLANCLIKLDGFSSEELDAMRDYSYRVVQDFSIEAFSDSVMALASLAINQPTQRASHLDDLILMLLLANRKR